MNRRWTVAVGMLMCEELSHDHVAISSTCRLNITR
jgi:hypothetical protein